jgi:hypothetical protein
MPPYARRAVIEEHCSKLRELILLNTGGWEDQRSLQRFQVLLRAAEARSADPACRALIRTLEERARELFSEHDHAKWAQGSTSGTDYLRLQILRDLDTLAALLVPAGRPLKALLHQR